MKSDRLDLSFEKPGIIALAVDQIEAGQFIDPTVLGSSVGKLAVQAEDRVNAGCTKASMIHGIVGVADGDVFRDEIHDG